MASQRDIKIGSTDFVVRVGGDDVPVKVMERQKKPSGRGYEYRLRRVDGSGKVFGRSLNRGSGALRRPGEAVKGFGGKAPTKKKAPPRKAKRNKPPTPAAPTAAKKPRRKTSTSPAPGNGASTTASPSPSLPSLRGRGRASATRAKPAPAQARKGKDTIQVRLPNDLIKRVIRGLEKLPKNADTYLVRNTVATVLAEWERAKYFPTMR